VDASWDDLDQELRRYYARRAPEYDDWYQRRGRYDHPESNLIWQTELGRLKHLARHFGSGRVLDIACGTGYWTRWIASNPQVAEVVALDQSVEMLEQTANRLRGVGLQATMLRGDAYALPFADQSFDRCFSGFFLGHVLPDRLWRILAEMRRVLRPDGALLVFDSLFLAGHDTVEIQDRLLADGAHYRVLKVFFTPQSLADALGSSFDREGVTTQATGRFFVIGEARALVRPWHADHMGTCTAES
jgi:demethylmenaquinone methyltransferase/2-methoxy-6-polyprenyl-1,4-benzoquinol methylase